MFSVIISIQINGDTGQGLTKAEIRRQTIKCAQNLKKLGCTANQRIAIIARNHHNLTPLLYSAFCLGAPVCPLDVNGGAYRKYHVRNLNEKKNNDKYERFQMEW